MVSHPDGGAPIDFANSSIYLCADAEQQPGSAFTGLISRLSIYNASLSAADVSAVYNGDAPFVLSPRLNAHDSTAFSLPPGAPPVIANQPASSMGAAPLASSPLQPPSIPMNIMTSSNTHVTLGNTSGSDGSRERGVPTVLTPDAGLHADLLGGSGATGTPHTSAAPTTAAAPTYGDSSHGKHRVLATLGPGLGPATRPPPQAGFVPRAVLERSITDPHGALETQSSEASFSVVQSQVLSAPGLLSDSPATSGNSWAELPSGARDSEHSTQQSLRPSPPPPSGLTQGVSWARNRHVRNLGSVVLPAAIQPTRGPASAVVVGAQPVGDPPPRSTLSSSPAVITADTGSNAGVAGSAGAQQTPDGGSNHDIGPGNGWYEASWHSRCLMYEYIY
ncbi:MAG: hypothetical protein WDW36_004485 [Sanguina aurantia]